MAVEDVRTRLLQAAGPVFADKGYQAATVREICDAAGVNLASVNYYFGDKESLYVETVKCARQMRSEQFPMPTWQADTPPEVRLRGFISTMVLRLVVAQESSWNTRLMLREVMEPTGVCQSLVEEYIRPLSSLLIDILAELLPATTPPHMLQQICFSIIGQCIYYRVAAQVVALLVPEPQYREHFQPGQLAEHITRWSLAALGVGASMREVVEAQEIAPHPGPLLHSPDS